MSEILIRQLVEEDWRIYREIRLRSLKQDPDSFCSTYDREVGRTDVQWVERLRLDARTKFSLPLVALLDSEFVGLACGIVHSDEDDVAYLYQMWVTPEARGSGIGRRLLIEIIQWAKGVGMRTLKLGVTSINTAAVRLYESVGFIPEGELEALRVGSDLRIQNMVLALENSNL